MINPVKCWNCNKVFGDVLQGLVYIMPSSDIPVDMDVLTQYQEEIRCPRCKKMNMKILLPEQAHEPVE